MTNTTKIKTAIEPYIREWLASQFLGRTFTERNLPLVGGGQHRFDAVSDDGLIVVEMLSNRSETRGNNENTGGVRKAQSTTDYLNRAPKEAQRLMVFTDSGFLALVQRRAISWETHNIQMLLCVLPPTLESLLNDILDQASQEQKASSDS